MARERHEESNYRSFGKLQTILCVKLLRIVHSMGSINLETSIHRR
jgi:hypothetical protein